MKKRTIKIFLLILLNQIIFSSQILAQIEHGGTPFGLHHKNTSYIEEQKLHFNLSEKQNSQKSQIKNQGSSPGEAMHAGFVIPANINPNKHGIWTMLGDSLKVWQVLISSSDAIGLGLVLDDFHLNSNQKLFVYDPYKQNISGGFTHTNNNEQQLLSIRLTPGETLVIELQEKVTKETPDNTTKPPFFVSELYHVWQGTADLNETKNLGNSDDCHVNVNCPEGALWQRQKRGVARMLMQVGNQLFWCSGSLINNTLEDGTPYFLTAAHCGDNASPDDMNAWQFYFNYERPDCYDVGAAAYNVINGAQLAAKGPLLEGSDFQLVLLNQTPPAYWQPYYNGWNILDEPSDAGVGIHHPAGDGKKISTYTETLTSAGPVVGGQQMAENSTWRINWTETETDFGVVQGGSSGSPLFNEQGLVVGTLTGGSSSCSSPNNPDYYGKMSYHWDQSPDPYEHLNYFLDPIGSGVTELPGFDPYHKSYPAPGFVSARPTDENQVELNWYKPMETPNTPGWHAYAHSYDDYTTEGPERATVFDANYFEFSYPVTLAKISHVFLENPASPWQDNQFIFKIYGHMGASLLYQSPVLEAQSLSEFIYELETPLTFNNKFYVVVEPVHPSGSPASVYKKTNWGNGVSLFGQPEDWQVAGSTLDNNKHVYLTKIFIEEQTGLKNGNKHTPLSENSLHANALSQGGSGQDILKWSNSVIHYNIFKNGSLIHTFEPDQTGELSYTFDGEPENDIDAYHVTAVYPEGVESGPSNKAYIFHQDFCSTPVTIFPYQEVFSSQEIPDCWTNESSNTGWQSGQQLEISGNTIEPMDGEYFVFIDQSSQEEEQTHWLISPPFDLQELELPVLSFLFNTSFAPESEGLLSVFVSKEDGSFNKIWDANDHPDYRNSSAYSWIKNVKNISQFKGSNVRLAFRISGNDDLFAAIDDVQVYEGTDKTHRLSLNATPHAKGEVYGAGHFIEGQKVTIKAYPNMGYHFHHWTKGESILSSLWDYSFIMPGENYTLDAFFSTEIPSSADELKLQSESITIYPNPNHGVFSLQSTKEKHNATIKVITANGKLLKTLNKKLITPNSVFSININTLTEGLYLLVVTYDGGREVKKFNIIP